MSAPGGRRSEAELLKHRELKEAALPQRAATMCAEAGKMGSQRLLLSGPDFRPRAGNGIDCERARWAEERTGDPVRQEVRGAQATLNDHAALWEPRAGK